ncbi:MAG: hypothetical protein JWP87_2742 [Labilithrix sp.]|nr:hypothetical protein [Labilithrix sp.]
MPHAKPKPRAPSPKKKTAAEPANDELARACARITKEMPGEEDEGYAPLAETVDILREHVTSAVVLSTLRGDDAKIPVGASKGAGLPDLPSVAAWPMRDGEPLSFILQLDLRSIETHGALPLDGLLSFFFSSGTQRRAEPAAAVIHTPKGVALKRCAPPPSPVFFFNPYAAVPATIEMHTAMALPELSQEELDDRFGLELRRYELLRERLMKWTKKKKGGNRNIEHLLLGHPRWRHGAPDGMRGRALLLQLDTDDVFTFGDAGLIYFTLPEADLRAHQFKRASAVTQ